uniref:Uncharacterized protein n=2 Tax=Anguilla anguilla TaxID=7936 RepID=A0A0E9V3P8_ANGAN
MCTFIGFELVSVQIGPTMMPGTATFHTAHTYAQGDVNLYVFV